MPQADHEPTFAVSFKREGNMAETTVQTQKGKQKAGASRAPAGHPRRIVTDENVEELSDRFDSLSPDDPEWDELGDALHRYMIG